MQKTKYSLKVVDYKAWHLKELAICERQKREVMCSIDDLAAASYTLALPAFTGLLNGEPVVIAGIRHEHDGVGVAWVLPTDKLQRFGKWFHSEVKRHLDVIALEKGYRRVQCSVDCKHTTGIRWARRLGFEVEGRMRRYGPKGEDYYLFARLFDSPVTEERK